ncbi:MAG: tyrosine-type recombinase/integrase [Acetobacteraceae bacterium]
MDGSTFQYERADESSLSARRRAELMVSTPMPEPEPEYELRQRQPHGTWCIWDRSTYVVSTRTKNKTKAEDFFARFKRHQDAKRLGLVDARYADATEICDYFEAQIPLDKPKRLRDVKYRLARLRPYIKGRELRQLDGAKVNTVMAAMAKAGSKPGSIQATVASFRAAIRRWCRDKVTPVVMPFDSPPRAPGLTRTLIAEEQAIARRWTLGDEDYDPATGTWSPPRRPLTPRERWRRRMFERILVLGLGAASRPGKHEGLAWYPSRRFGHIDLATGQLFRCPLGTPAELLKLAPTLLMGSELVKYVRRWWEEDGPDALYVIRKLDGTPMTRAGAQLFERVMRKLGIEGVTRHTLRHTSISAMIAAGVPASVISSAAGISMQVLRTRYNHSDDRLVQHIAHPGLDLLLVKGLRVLD